VEYIIIALHGWKGNLESMKIIKKAFDFKNTKWLFLQGPYKVNDKEFSWYKKDNLIGYQCTASLKLLKKTISNILKSGFPINKIYLLGFSQGACIAMNFLAKQKLSIGGIIPISGFIHQKNKFKRDITSSNPNTPILLIHCHNDIIVPSKESHEAYELFMEAGFDVKLHLLNGGHKIPLKAKGLIRDFIEKSKN
tara:strand:+ start:738 stop:1319 length:582 start_codon:yes stop_codon:yes gene_type:complete